jgi:two-component system nitrogen regulation response regulator GlnG
MRILLVEDDDAVRNVLIHVLKSFKHDVLSVTNQADAAEALSGFKPEVILLDLLLDGDVATPFIKTARDLMPETPPRIIVVSALRGADKIAENEHAEYLAKPFQLDDLEELIGRK